MLYLCALCVLGSKMFKTSDCCCNTEVTFLKTLEVLSIFGGTGGSILASSLAE